MAQDMIISILLYFCIFQNPTTSAAFSLGDFATECQNCAKFDKKIPARDPKSKYNIHEYTHPRRLVSVHHLQPKSWGARGMPFNVLYTPNLRQQKMMKYVQHKQEERRPEKEDPRVYNLVLEAKKPLKAKGHKLKKHAVARKYYSLIPQLFVSYW